jgi:PAS domain S-box-containing protein
MEDKERILIVDDDQGTRQSLALVFQKQGYETDTAATGRQAMERAQHQFFNVAFIDIRLPDMEGVALLEPLTEIHPDMVLILMTGYASLETVVQAMNQGASAYITKPLDLDDVMRKVGEVLEKQQLILENRRLYQAAQRELAERRRAEEELAQERYLLQTLMQTIPDHIYFKDREGRFVRVNQAMARWVGVSDPIEVEGKTDFDFFTNEHAQQAYEDEAQVIKTGCPLVGMEERETWPDGRETWVSTTKMPLYDQEGQIIGTFGVSRDIAKRKQSERRLRETERRFRTLLDNVRLVAVGLDTDGQVTYANPFLVELTGYEFDQILGKEWHQVFVPERDRAAAVQAFRRNLQNQNRPYQEYSLLTTKGDERLIAWNHSVLLDEMGRPVGTMSIGEDITERVQAERELHQHATQLALLNEIGGQIAAELELKSVLDRAAHLVRESFGYHHVALFIVDGDTKELVMKARAGSYATLFPKEHRIKAGVGMVGWVGMHGERFLSNDVRAELQYVENFRAALPTMSELSVPVRVGQEIAGVLDVQSPQVDAFDDNDVMVMETLADQIAVAIRNSRLWEEMQQRVDELAFLNSASQVMVSSLDLEQVMETTMRQATEVLQVEAGSVLLFRPETGELVFEAASGGGAAGLPGKALAPGQGVAGWVAQHATSLIVHDVRKDERFYSGFDAASENFETRSILCVPLIYRDRVIGVMQALNKIEGEFSADDQRLLEALASTAATAIENARLHKEVQRELSERVRAEEALREERASLARRVAERTAELSAANAELARAARLKDEFLASMSHELRTPLNAILGLSEALQEEVYGDLNEKQLQALSRVEESGRHLLELINEILDISKIEAGKLELELQPTSLESVCQASLRLVKQMAQRKHLRVTSHVDHEVGTIRADGRRLKQILVNLLTNACKFTSEGGSVGLEVVGDVEAQVVRLAVWDTGIGIAAQDLERLFQPFVQLDSSLSRRYAGTGLGLALVQRLTELHGGGIIVESELGKGSKFTVSLPWRKVESETAAAERAMDGASRARQRTGKSAKGSSPLILLAEDNEDNITTVLDYLEEKAYRVIVARNGLEAIRRVRQDRPDVILMDIQMPELDGLEAIKRIRAGGKTMSEIPIIALTALAMPGDRERCLEAGASVYLSKPVSLRGLAEAVEIQLDGR